MSDLWNQPCNTEYSYPHRTNPYHYLQGTTGGFMWAPVNPNVNHNIELSLPELEIRNERMREVLPPRNTTANMGSQVTRSRRRRNR